MLEDFLLQSYNYHLPAEQIAQFPCSEPGASRLLVVSRKGDQEPVDSHFAKLPGLLPPDALLVANNCRVLPARLLGKRENGGKAEFLLLTPLPLVNSGNASPEPACANGDPIRREAQVECLLKPSAKLPVGSTIFFDENLSAQVLEKGVFGRHKVKLSWQGDLEAIFARLGRLPLPPYIRRHTQQADSLRYQTCYASKTGAVAAPTAGLHFTPQMRETLAKNNFQWHELTLYVGYGTFSPVREADIHRHHMHHEYVELDEATARAIAKAKADGRPIVAIGTTSLRALEGIAARDGEIRPFSGWTDIFIYPGYKFNVVDALLTNFHLPQSSLLMLVSAFAGRKNILDAYALAVDLGYKFFSYGDAMLLRP